MSTEAIVSVIVRPTLEPPYLVQLVNQCLPGQAENYFIVGQKLIRCDCGEENVTEQWSVPILTPFARKIMAPLKDSRIPPVSKPQFKQVDGCRYELFFGYFFSHLHYQWWVSPPEGWEPLAEKVRIG
jgi:hypothetical protein